MLDHIAMISNHREHHEKKETLTNAMSSASH